MAGDVEERPQKALTLTQPWASLVILGIKRWETRGWYPRTHRGRLVIHAAKGWTRDDRDYAAELYAEGILPIPPNDLPRAVVLGTVSLNGLVRTATAIARGYISETEREMGDYSEGRYAWELGDPRAFAEPIPARGALGLWDWSPSASLSPEAR